MELATQKQNKSSNIVDKIESAEIKISNIGKINTFEGRKVQNITFIDDDGKTKVIAILAENAKDLKVGPAMLALTKFNDKGKFKAGISAKFTSL